MAMKIKLSSKRLFIITSSTLIILKLIFTITSISSTSELIIHNTDDHHQFDSKLQMFGQSSETFYSDQTEELQAVADDDKFGMLTEDGRDGGGGLPEVTGSASKRGGGEILMVNVSRIAVVHEEGRRPAGGSMASKVKPLHVTEVYHEKDIFLQNYNQMNKTFKIYIYPHPKTDPFANVFLPHDGDSISGNYASESYFKTALSMSHFVTQDPSKADLFFMPFSIACMRNDKRIGVDGIKDFIKDYIFNIRREYPFWNRTGGADHFYVTCHSIGRTAMEKAPEVSMNASQVVCSSSYYVQGYKAHKDTSMPQVWPRLGVRPTRHPWEREILAFYAGEMNSRVRESLVQTWINDTDISVHRSRLKTPYFDSLLGSKFCIHAKGFEVNTARIADAIYYGCVPVVLADYYDLPFADILNWSSLSVVIPTEDIPFLKRILKAIIDSGDYIRLQKNVLMVQKHFEWHKKPVDFDTFYMVMYELWVRRSSVKIY